MKSTMCPISPCLLLQRLTVRNEGAGDRASSRSASGVFDPFTPLQQGERNQFGSLPRYPSCASSMDAVANPRKRAKQNDLDVPSLPVISRRSADLFLADGNIVLRTRSITTSGDPPASSAELLTHYKVHKAVLGLHCVAFKDLLEGTSDDVFGSSELYEGVLVMDTHDEPEDLDAFLKAIYLHKCVDLCSIHRCCVLTSPQVGSTIVTSWIVVVLSIHLAGCSSWRKSTTQRLYDKRLSRYWKRSGRPSTGAGNELHCRPALK